MSEENGSNKQLVIKNGFLVTVVQFKTVKLITTFLSIALVFNVFFSCKLFVFAINIRNHLGYFLNMISSGDGDTLPNLLAVPVVFFLMINLIMALFLYMCFDNTERPDLNRMMFFLFLLALVLLIIILIIVICVIAHAFGEQQKLHDGIVTAMNNYLNNSEYKIQMDMLQIEFQCCGSRKYDEWYTIKWMDTSLEQGNSSAVDGNTPFSCCSMKSLSPCIHHNIEVTGKAYLYTPEFNLSVSTRGCFEIIREKKEFIALDVMGYLLLVFFLETLTSILFRFIQTGHFEKGKFSGKSRSYTIWLFGSYSGKVKKDEPPDVPPVPAELKD